MGILETYDELHRIIVKKCGIELDEKLIFDQYYLTVHEYIISVAEHGGSFMISSQLYSLSHNPEHVRIFLSGVAARIIMETVNHNPEYEMYYKNIIKKNNA